MNIVTSPPFWSSAHRPIEYTLDFYKNAPIAVGDNGGKANWIFLTPPFFPFVVGNYIYVEQGSLSGYQKIIEVTSQTNITTDKDYIADLTATYIRNIVIPLIRVYKGYLTGEPYDAELPFELVASLRPPVSPDYDVQIDISGYLKSIFRILPPTNGIDFNMFNQYRVFMFYSAAQTGTTDIELFTSPSMVLNSSIKTEDLHTFVNTGRFLQEFDALLFSCGRTVLTLVQNLFVKNIIAEGDIETYFNNDFNSDFSKIGG